MCLSFRFELVDEFPKILKELSFFEYSSYLVLSNSALPYFRYGIKFTKSFKTLFLKKNANSLYTSKQPLMMAYEGSESAPNNFGKFIYQFHPETTTHIRKHERILYKLYRQNLSSLFNETCLYIYIYIYIY